MDGIDLIAQERKDQIEKHKRTVEYDREFNNKGQLLAAIKALIHLNPIMADRPVNWSETIWRRMIEKPYRERLIIAASLIAAELDRTKTN